MEVIGLLMVKVADVWPLYPDPETAVPLPVYHFHDKPVPEDGVTDMEAEPPVHIGAGDEGLVMVGAAFTVSATTSLVSEHEPSFTTQKYEPLLEVAAGLMVSVAEVAPLTAVLLDSVPLYH